MPPLRPLSFTPPLPRLRRSGSRGRPDSTARPYVRLWAIRERVAVSTAPPADAGAGSRDSWPACRSLPAPGGCGAPAPRPTTGSDGFTAPAPVTGSGTAGHREPGARQNSPAPTSGSGAIREPEAVEPPGRTQRWEPGAVEPPDTGSGDPGVGNPGRTARPPGSGLHRRQRPSRPRLACIRTPPPPAAGFRVPEHRAAPQTPG